LSEPEPLDEQKPESADEPESVSEPVAEPESVDEPESVSEPESVDEPESVSEPVAEPESVDEPESVSEPVAEPEPEDEGNSHLFAVRTTGGQEKIVMRLLEARIKMEKINIQSVLLLSDLKGYVVVEAQDVSAMFDAIQGIRHIRGQLRGELTYNEIDKYLIKKSTVSELAVENTVEIIAGPFKGMKATITRLEQEKEEATVILLDATYQLPVTVDANYLKLVPA
jgi:transcriptional antiterminator NusG